MALLTGKYVRKDEPDVYTSDALDEVGNVEDIVPKTDLRIRMQTMFPDDETK